MVRKRKSRKDSSDEEDDEDVDFTSAEVEEPPSPKPRYSLRQRKKQVIIDDFDYEDEDEHNLIELHKSDGEYSADDQESPEDDFDEEFSVKSKPKTRVRRLGSSTSNSSRKQIAVKVDYGSGQPASMVEVVSAMPRGAAPEVDSEGPIDFEDIIRADIVVNKKRIDFENYIQRNEIEVPEAQVEEQQEESDSKRKRRSRRPKRRPSYLEDDCTSLVEAQINEGTSNSDDMPLSLALLQKTVPDEVAPPSTVINQNPQPPNVLPAPIQNNTNVTCGYLVFPNQTSNGTPPVATPVIITEPITFPNGNALPVITSLSTVAPELPISNQTADLSKTATKTVISSSPAKAATPANVIVTPPKPNGGLISVKNLNDLLDAGRINSAKADSKDCDSDSDVEIIEEKREIIVLDDDDD